MGWARLLKRVFDIAHCPFCGGSLKIIADPSTSIYAKRPESRNQLPTQADDGARFEFERVPDGKQIYSFRPLHRLSRPKQHRDFYSTQFRLTTRRSGAIARDRKRVLKFPMHGLSRGHPIRSGHFIGPEIKGYRSWVRWRAIFTGDIDSVFRAAQRLQSVPDQALYKPEELREDQASFVYSPHLAFRVSPLVFPGESLESAANRVSYINHGLALAGLLLLLRVVNDGKHDSWLDNAALSVPFFLFYPITKALDLTQLSVWIFFLVALSFYLFSTNRRFSVGVVLGLGVSIKPHLIAIPALLLLRGGMRFEIFAGCVLSLVGVAAVSIGYAGLDNCLPYVLHALPMLSAGYGYLPNHSIKGSLIRMFTDTDSEHFSLENPPSWIRVGSLLFSAFVVLVSLRELRSDSSECRSYGELLVFGASVAASPILWEHHLTVLLVAYPTCLPVLRSHGLDLALFASFLLVVFGLETRYLPNGTTALLSIPKLYGALALLACMLCMVRRVSGPRNA